MKTRLFFLQTNICILVFVKTGLFFLQTMICIFMPVKTGLFFLQTNICILVFVKTRLFFIRMMIYILALLKMRIFLFDEKNNFYNEKNFYCKKLIYKHPIQPQGFSCSLNYIKFAFCIIRCPHNPITILILFSGTFARESKTPEEKHRKFLLL